MKKVLVSLLATVLTLMNVDAQNAELSNAWNSKDRIKKVEKLEKAIAKGAPQCGVKNLQTMVDGTAALALEVFAMNDVLPEMYKRTIGESIDGVVDVTVEKPSLEELAKLSASIVAMGGTLGEISQAVPVLKDEIAGVAPTLALQAGKAVDFVSSSVTVLAAEIELQSKIIAYLIEQKKSEKNL